MASHYFCRFMQSSQTGMKQLFSFSLSTYSLYLCFLTVSVCIVLFFPIIFSFLFSFLVNSAQSLFLSYHCFFISSSLPIIVPHLPLLLTSLSPHLILLLCFFLFLTPALFISPSFTCLFSLMRLLFPLPPPPFFSQLPLFRCLSLSFSSSPILHPSFLNNSPEDSSFPSGNKQVGKQDWSMPVASWGRLMVCVHNTHTEANFIYIYIYCRGKNTERQTHLSTYRRKRPLISNSWGLPFSCVWPNSVERKQKITI